MGWTTKTADGLRNVHARTMPGSRDQARALLSTLAGEHDRVWPARPWPPLRLDKGLHPGSYGGHGTVRYSVEHADEDSVLFRFSPEGPFEGTHELRIDVAAPGQVRWTHVLTLTDPSPWVRIVVVPLHDALLEDLLDTVQEAMTGQEPPQRALARGVLARRREDEATLAGRRPAAAVAATVLGGAAALHALWATGSTWPFREENTLARYVIGDPRRPGMPGPAACLAVTVALGTAAAATVDRVRSRDAAMLPFPVSDATVRLAAAALAVRGVVGLATTTFAARPLTPEFAKLDRSVYSPLCLGLAWSLRATAGGLRPRSPHDTGLAGRASTA